MELPASLYLVMFWVWGKVALVGGGECLEGGGGE